MGKSVKRGRLVRVAMQDVKEHQVLLDHLVRKAETANVVRSVCLDLEVFWVSRVRLVVQVLKEKTVKTDNLAHQDQLAQPEIQVNAVHRVSADCTACRDQEE